MINHVRKFYILPLMLAGIMCSCSPGGESPNPPNSNSSRQAQQTAPQAPQPTVVQQPVAATPKVVVEPQPQPVAPANAPKLFVATTRVDFGKQPMDKTINRTIVLKNVGKSDLKIESVVPSWGCTAVDFPKVLPPGKAGSIKVKVETGKNPGAHVKSVTINSNDPTQPKLQVDLAFEVK